MDTVFGIKWPIPTALDIGILFFIFFALFFLLLYAYNRFIIQNKKSQAFNLFLFKTRHLGLSSFKIKVLKSFIDSIALRNPISLLNRPKLFETAIIKFYKYLKKHNETTESISAIFREIISIYELLYHPFTYRKKLKKSMISIEDNLSVFL
ncbi:MAG: hypothetical protein SVR08_16345 [Spirochaetota bacterium]|nr:hypothetical protein [Spirochaetota bacterium]